MQRNVESQQDTRSKARQLEIRITRRIGRIIIIIIIIIGHRERRSDLSRAPAEIHTSTPYDRQLRSNFDFCGRAPTAILIQRCLQLAKLHQPPVPLEQRQRPVIAIFSIS